MKAPTKVGFYWEYPDKDWLEYHYITLRKSARRMGQDVGTTAAVVIRWLKTAGIPSRTRTQSRRLVAQTIPRSRGPESAVWQGGSSYYFHLEARRTLQEAGVTEACARCGKTEGKICAHHRNGNVENNALENLEWLCNSCHLQLHVNLKHKEVESEQEIDSKL